MKVFWCDSVTVQPNIQGVPSGELLGDSDDGTINGSLFIGDKRMMTTGCCGERTRLVPAVEDEGLYSSGTRQARSPGYYRDWIRAARGGKPA